MNLFVKLKAFENFKTYRTAQKSKVTPNHGSFLSASPKLCLSDYTVSFGPSCIVVVSLCRAVIEEMALLHCWNRPRSFLGAIVAPSDLNGWVMGENEGTRGRAVFCEQRKLLMLVRIQGYV